MNYVFFSFPCSQLLNFLSTSAWSLDLLASSGTAADGMCNNLFISMYNHVEPLLGAEDVCNINTDKAVDCHTEYHFFHDVQNLKKVLKIRLSPYEFMWCCAVMLLIQTNKWSSRPALQTLSSTLSFVSHCSLWLLRSTTVGAAYAPVSQRLNPRKFISRSQLYSHPLVCFVLEFFPPMDSRRCGFPSRLFLMGVVVIGRVGPRAALVSSWFQTPQTSGL